MMKKYFVFLIIVLGVILLFSGSSSATTSVNGSAINTHNEGPSQYKDLVVTSISAPTHTAKSQNISVTTTVKNQGNLPINSGFYTYFYMVPTKSLSGSKTYLGRHYYSSLGAGKSSSKVTKLTVPTTITAGSYYIAAKVDGNNLITESNETNNVKYTTSKTIVYPKKIDSGVTVTSWTKYYWVTYVDSRNFVIIYTHFYNPNVGHVIYQKHTIGLWNSPEYPPNSIYYLVVPKANGQSSYMHIFGSIQNISPVNYYWKYFQPPMKAGTMVMY